MSFFHSSFLLLPPPPPSSPGAPSVAELDACGAYAKAQGVPVYMGYNKNVTKYVTLARAAEDAAGPGASTAFYHNNTYTKAGLPECFERNRCTNG